MKLTKLHIKNFRCFGSEGVTLSFDKLTALIGANGAGKTAALAALQKMFSPVDAERLLKRSDFHFSHLSDALTSPARLTIEAVFEFADLQDGSTARDSIPALFEHLVINDVTGTPLLRVRLVAEWTDDGSADGNIDQHLYYVACAEGEEAEDDDLKPVRGGLRSLIQFLYVPAVRNPSSQLRNMTGTLMNRMMRCVRISDQTKTSISDASQAIAECIAKEPGVDEVFSCIKEEWSHYRYTKRFSNVGLKYASDDIADQFNQMDVCFSPSDEGRECGSQEIGDGLRSLLHITLANAVLDVYTKIRLSKRDTSATTWTEVHPPALTIVAVEEPENHIAPQLLGKTIENLISMAKKDGAQAIISSHSPSIVKRVKPTEIRHFWVDPTTHIASINMLDVPSPDDPESLYKFVANAVIAYPELYFAKLVVLCEGASEQVILPRVLSTISGHSIDASEIAVVPLGGRHVNHFWRLLKSLQIPFVTLLDLDKGREGGCFGRIKYAVEQLLLYGADKNSLLRKHDGTVLSVVSVEELQKSATDESAALDFWLKRLEDNGVFYSAPLDVDFLMLEAMPSAYKSILDTNEGPVDARKGGRIKIWDLEKRRKKITKKRILTAVRSTLKSDKASGDGYTDAQKTLMIWYEYFFLGRGKPSVHVAALSNVRDEDLVVCKEGVLHRLSERAASMLCK